MNRFLEIEGWKTSINQIQIEPYWDKNLVDEEFRLSINVYEDENADDFDFKFHISHLVMPKEFNPNELETKRYDFSKEDIINLSDIYSYGEEYQISQLTLDFLLIEGKNKLKGVGKLENDNKILNFKFQADYIINDLNIWEMNAELKKNRQKNINQEIIRVLDQLSDKEDCINYKKAVPFVHIPYELFSQWESCYNPKYKYFNEWLDKDKKDKLKNFDNYIALINKIFDDNIPDVPEIFKYKEWQLLMEKSSELSKEIKNVWNNA